MQTLKCFLDRNLAHLLDMTRYCLFKIQILLHCKSRYFVFDIDNTLASSWISFLQSNWNSEHERLMSLARLPSMFRIFKSVNNLVPDAKIIFLSARNFRYFSTTYKWLDINGFNPSIRNVILTPNAKDKIKYLRVISSKASHCYLFDDLSFGHESGAVSYYEDLIADIRSLKIVYFGYQAICEIEANKIPLNLLLPKT